MRHEYKRGFARVGLKVSQASHGYFFMRLMCDTSMHANEITSGIFGDLYFAGSKGPLTITHLVYISAGLSCIVSCVQYVSQPPAPSSAADLSLHHSHVIFHGCWKTPQLHHPVVDEDTFKLFAQSKCFITSNARSSLFDS